MMRMVVLAGCLWAGLLPAQDLFYITFVDKPADGVVQLDAKAQARRSRHGLPAADWYDLPLNPDYVADIATRVDSVRQQLRWFNAVSVAGTPAQMEEIARLPFVKGVEPFGFGGKLTVVVPEDSTPRRMSRDTSLYHFQREQMGLDFFLSRHLDGKGVRICIVDAGFKGADEHPGLRHLFENKQIVATRDFFGKGKDPFYHSSHGTSVLGCIAGKWGDLPIGAATGAEFLLARTENNYFEPAREEDLWLAAIEWADQKGADLVSSSLGYTSKRYTYADMDGWTAKASLAARIATRKGMLVINSQGNDGAGKFHYVNAPGDVDSVLTVGATFPMIPLHMRFSSYGPNAKGQMKPDVCAPGYVLTTGRKGYVEITGTSFSTPLTTGFAACILQQNPGKTNMELHQMIRESGHLYPYYDYVHGYGVPQARHFFRPSDSVVVSFTTETNAAGDTTWLMFTRDLPERNQFGKDNGRVLYYRLENAQGKILAYESVVIRPGTLRYPVPAALGKLGKLRIWFDGYEELWEQQ